MSPKTQLNALVVEDEEVIRQATVRALRNEGFWCEVASNGNKALEKLRNNFFDVVICDLRMPEMNGHSLAVELLAMVHRPAVIVLTGVLEPRLARDLLRRGVDDIIAKPANYDFLVLKARTLAERRRLLLPDEVARCLVETSTETSTSCAERDQDSSTSPSNLNSPAPDVVTPGELWPDPPAYVHQDLSVPEVRNSSSEITQPVGAPNRVASPPQGQYLPLKEVTPGMSLLQEVQSKDGRLLVSNGVELTSALLDRIRRFANSIGIVEPIFVRVPAVATAQATCSSP